MVDYNSKSELVSVIIPCYNHGAFLREAVESVLVSQYSPIEIIIVNDGSTDNSEDVAIQLTIQHENIFYHYQPNKGPAAARNKGIAESKGTYILPLDADDKISDRYITEAVNVIRKNEEIKIVYCNADMFGLKKGPWKLKAYSKKKIASHNMIFSCALFRKSDWEKVGGYSEELIYCDEDWDFWISMIKNGGHVHKLDFIGFHYRILENSRRRGMTNEYKQHALDHINRKHCSFMASHFNGPLRKHRSLSKPINIFFNLFNFF